MKLVDKIKEYGDVYLQGLKSLKKAIKDGGIFFVPEDIYDLESWPRTASNTMMQIDMGKFFTAGYLTDIIERDDSGKVKFYFGVKGSSLEDANAKSEALGKEVVDMINKML